MVRNISTKSFFQLNDADQAAVVRAHISDIEGCIGRHLNAEDDGKAKQRVLRLREKAAKYGIYV